MKNTLKLVVILIGLGFLLYGAYQLLVPAAGADIESRQLYGMLGVGALFLLAGFAMSKR